MFNRKELVERHIEKIDEYVSEKNVEATKLYFDALHGDRRAAFKFSEDLAVGDLPSQIVPLIRRTLLTNYSTVATVWDKFTDVQEVVSVDRYEELMKVNFLDQSNIPGSNFGDTFIPGALPTVAPGTLYPLTGLTGTSKYIKAGRVGEAFGIDWASIVNTRGANIDIIGKAIEAFAKHAAGAEDVAATRLLVTGGGINAGSFNGASGYGGNHLTSDAPLVSILDLQAAIQQAQTFWIDYTNVQFTEFALVVPPQAVANANQVLSSKEITSVGSTTARATKYKQEIDLGATVTVVGNRWLTNPSLGGSVAQTAWFLVPIASENPVLSSIRLKGYEVPSYFVKSTNSTSVGGGDTGLLEGDFESDAIQSKVRHVVGGAALWTQGIVYSLGTGTATAGPVSPLSGLMPVSGTTASGTSANPNAQQILVGS